MERDFLALLYRTRRRLPDRAEYRPEADVYVQVDFYYERSGLPGVAVFCDGSPHDQPAQMVQDRSVREALADRGYRVIVVRYDRDLEQQIREHEDVFGPGSG